MSNLRVVRRRATLSFSRYNRARKARYAIEFAERHGVRSVLLVGVTEFNDPHQNIVENAFIRAGFAVTPSGISTRVEGWNGYVVADGRRLPFADASFDLVYSNAVIEHVGGSADQRRFVMEHARVGRSWILTAPNRWFPIEAHSDDLFKHWLPNWHDQWGSVTRLLSPRTLRELLPDTARIVTKPWAPTLTAVSG